MDLERIGTTKSHSDEGMRETSKHKRGTWIDGSGPFARGGGGVILPPFSADTVHVFRAQTGEIGADKQPKLADQQILYWF